MRTKAGNYYQETDYSAFKRLLGNRDVSPARVRKIKRSIEKVGYLPEPVIVNEKMEVIDGQGRIAALKELGIPVYFIIAQGAGINECTSMNLDRENWSTMDHIKSYAERGDEPYKYLLALCQEYKDFNVSVILNAVKGTSGSGTKTVKERKFQCNAEEYEDARAILDYEARFKDILKKIGNMNFVCYALSFCYKHKEIDNERLYKKMNEKAIFFAKPSDTNQALVQIEKFYNERCRNKCYIATEYKKYNVEKYGWYGPKWGNK